MRWSLVPLFVLATTAAAQDATDVADRYLAQERRAFALFEAGTLSEAITAFEAQIAIYADNPRPYYNIACAYARQGNAARAATWLRLSIARGWRDAEHLAADPDLDPIRRSAAFKACVAQLALARQADPDPMPRQLAPESVPTAPSVAVILTASYVEEQMLLPSERLLGAHEYRKRLFQVYDRRMAMLARYIGENGDARDADSAARARVDTATRYLQTATGESTADATLRDVASRYVLLTAEEFLRGYPGSVQLPHVLLQRAHAFRRLGRLPPAERAFRVLIDDYPGTATATRAELQLCVLLADAGRVRDLKPAFRALRDRAATRPALAMALRDAALLKARLLAEGLPGDAAEKLVPDPAFAGVYVFAFVAVGSPLCEKRIAALRDAAGPARRVVVACVDPRDNVPDDRRNAWLAKHHAGGDTHPYSYFAVEALGLARVPTVIAARASGEVLAVDPTPAELAALAH